MAHLAQLFVVYLFTGIYGWCQCAQVCWFHFAHKSWAASMTVIVMDRICVLFSKMFSIHNTVNSLLCVVHMVMLTAECRGLCDLDASVCCAGRGLCVIWMPVCGHEEARPHGLLLRYWSLYVNDIKRQECRANVTIPVRPKPKPRTNLIVQFWTDKINLNSSIVYLVCMIMDIWCTYPI